jgi:hypothetical protein
MAKAFCGLAILVLAVTPASAAGSPTVVAAGVSATNAGTGLSPQLLSSYLAYTGTPLPGPGGGCAAVYGPSGSPALRMAGVGTFHDTTDNVFFPAATFIFGSTSPTVETNCATYEAEVGTTSGVELDIYGVPGGHLICGLSGSISRSLFHLTADFTTNGYGCTINNGPAFSPITVHIDAVLYPEPKGGIPLGPVTEWGLEGAFVATTAI